MSSSIEMTITQTHSVNRSMDHHFTKCQPEFQTLVSRLINQLEDELISEKLTNRDN